MNPFFVSFQCWAPVGLVFFGALGDRILVSKRRISAPHKGVFHHRGLGK